LRVKKLRLGIHSAGDGWLLAGFGMKKPCIPGFACSAVYASEETL
jgi:hypothetical protein